MWNIPRSPVLPLAAMLVCSGLLFATDYYVSTEGSDSNNGSAASPWRTIQRAATAAAAGDTIHVQPGTYTESPYCKAQGTAAAPIRFVSDVTWAARIMGDGQSNWAFRIDGDYTTLERFDITNVSPSGHLGVETEGNYDSIIGNHIHHIAPHGGADKLGGAGIVNGGDIRKGYLNTIGNTVHDIGDLNRPWYQVHGIYYGSKGGEVSGNIVYRTQGWGIHLWHAATDITISDNQVFDNRQGGILVGAGDYPCPPSGPACVTADYVIVKGNTVYNNAGTGDLGGYGIIEEGHTGTHNEYLENIVYGNAVGSYRLQNGNVPH